MDGRTSIPPGSHLSRARNLAMVADRMVEEARTRHGFLLNERSAAAVAAVAQLGHLHLALALVSESEDSS